MTEGANEGANLLYGVPAIAAFLNITPRQAHHQIEKGGLPTFRIGGVICARKSSLNDWLEAMETAARTTGKS
ncbi:hypothetical protein SAMN05216548_109151 [Faunimonas pinastri]|uniref:Helix-turn-helix domain-containing protein n=2 Tax=Faunimonas pinastri TaxID=1855383 RepID=A0A1H9KBV6_9HYPH|nr:hypothetical protein SAMN05216548_109151 [Faunimonas pinastri]